MSAIAPRIRSGSTRLGLVSLFLLAVTLGACSSDDPDIDPMQPPPVVLADSVVFTVTTFDTDGTPRVRWIGDEDGPLDISPEGTSMPWVGYGRRFEISWEAWSENGAVTGYQWRASQIPNVHFLPRDSEGQPEYADIRSLMFTNDTSEESVEGMDCPEGRDCPLVVRWASNQLPYQFSIRILDETGEERRSDLGFFANYPPTTEWQFEGSGCDDPIATPRLEWIDGNGELMRCVVAEGDTVSAGAYLVVKAGGEDRVLDLGTTEDDSFCCDLKLDPEAPPARVQYRVWYSTISSTGEPSNFSTFWSEAEIDTIGFVTAPFDITVQARAVDEHGRPDPDVVSWSVIGGYLPRLVSITPDEGDFVLLRHPEAPTPWTGNSLEYEVERDVGRYWISSAGRYWDSNVSGSIPIGGTVFRLPLRLESTTDPRESTVEWLVAGEGYSGAVESWSYEVVSEKDPDNLIIQGDGADNLAFFTTAGEDGVWDMEGGLDIFVPDIFWDRPEEFDPNGDCPVPLFCELGAHLEAELGRLRLAAQGRVTTTSSIFRLFMDSIRPQPTTPQAEVQMERLGRVTSLDETNFEVYIGLDVEGNPDPVRWPPE